MPKLIEEDDDELAPTKKRNLMEDFVISEISAVDRGAQKGAVMTIMKRDDSGDRRFRKHPPGDSTIETRLPTGKRHVIEVDPDDQLLQKEDEAVNEFDAKVAEVAKRDGLPLHLAMRKVRESEPALFQKYQRAPVPTFQKAATPDAVLTFEKRIDEIAGRDKIGKDVAMQKARQEHPDEFERYQAA